jgi:hypothetical protein
MSHRARLSYRSAVCIRSVSWLQPHFVFIFAKELGPSLQLEAEDEADAGECEVSKDPPATPPIEAAILGEAKWEDLACTKATCSHNCDPLL